MDVFSSPATATNLLQVFMRTHSATAKVFDLRKRIFHLQRKLFGQLDSNLLHTFRVSEKQFLQRGVMKTLLETEYILTVMDSIFG